MTIPRAAPPAPTPQERLELAWFEAGCAINTLRNRQGTGHGRPFLPSVTQPEATSAVQQMGLIAADMLRRLWVLFTPASLLILSGEDIRSDPSRRTR
jgi:hypothetical protein